MESFTLQVNEVSHTVVADPDTPLLWVIRDSIGLTGTKYGCGVGMCGACTVLFEERAIRSCQIPIRACHLKSVTTIEGLTGADSQLLREAWHEFNVPQCGYCQAGQLMAATDLLRRKKTPTVSDIHQSMSGILCRCGTYPRIRKAILSAVKKRTSL